MYLSHSESFSLFLTYTHIHLSGCHLKPLVWFYSAAETSCRLSSPGSQSGSDVETHIHRHEYMCVQLCNTGSNTYKFFFSPTRHRHTQQLNHFSTDRFILGYLQLDSTFHDTSHSLALPITILVELGSSHQSILHSGVSVNPSEQFIRSPIQGISNNSRRGCYILFAVIQYFEQQL